MILDEWLLEIREIQQIIQAFVADVWCFGLEKMFFNPFPDIDYIFDMISTCFFYFGVDRLG